MSLHRSPTSFTCLSSSPLRPTRDPRFKVSARGSLRRRLSLPASLPVSSRLHTAPLHRGAIGLGIVVVPRRHRARAEKRRANRPSFFAWPPPSHSLYREEAGRCSPSRTRTGHRVASRFFSRTFSIQESQSLFVVQFGEEGNSSKLCGIERRKGGRKRGVWSFYGNLIRNGDSEFLEAFWYRREDVKNKRYKRYSRLPLYIR